MTDGLHILKEKLPLLPTTPGVYRMLGDKGQVLYVGKAKNLRHRVTSYTQPDRLTVRIRRMVFETRDLEVVQTATEVEALILEANLVKSLQPRYNIRLKDDGSFPFIHVSDHAAPRLAYYRGPKKGDGHYFGPYPSGEAVSAALEVIERVFKLRTCTDSTFNARTRPCLKYHIKRCTAPCVGRIADEAYAASVKEAMLFLQGKGDGVQKMIQQRMAAAAAAERYEDAALERDRLKLLATALAQQVAVAQGLADADVVAVVLKGGRMAVQMFVYRNGAHIGNARYFPDWVENENAAEAVAAFLALHYATRTPPRDILCNVVPEGTEVLAEALSQKAGVRVTVSAPQRGDKAKVVAQALENAEAALDRKLAEGESQRAQLEDFAQMLGLDRPIRRIETFDISNIQGKHPVASMVVAGPDGMVPSAYRKFGIRGKDTPDDYAMMREALTRRYSRLRKEGNPDDWPDVVMVDGGVAHLNVLVQVFRDLDIDGPALCAIAKGPERDKGLEKLWRPGRPDPLDIPFNSALLFLLQRIRDEAHRTAIGYHRTVRAKALVASALDGVPGIGPKRKKALLSYFGSAAGVKAATVDELMRVDGISRAMAEAIYGWFRS
jgi:excinuclease ABC subunit C